MRIYVPPRPVLVSLICGKLGPPLNSKCFLWQAARGKLSASDQILKRNATASEFCDLCGAREDTTHILFSCSLAKLAWACVRECFLVSWNPGSFRDVRSIAKSLVGSHKRLFWICWAATAWVMWTTRNKFTIEHKFPSKPAQCLYVILSLLLQWKSSIKEVDKDDLDLIISRIRCAARRLSASPG